MSSPVATHENRATDADLPADYGLISGVATYLLGFAVVYSWSVREIESTLSGINAVAGLFGEATIPTWKAVGWVFYNTHLVALDIPVPGGAVSRDLIAVQGGSAALYLLPPAMLTVAGWIVARQARTLPDLRAGARAGATVVVGYLLVAVAGAFVLSVDAFGSTIGPDLLGAAAIAGLVYPAVFGALGGVVAALFD